MGKSTGDAPQRYGLLDYHQRPLGTGEGIVSNKYGGISRRIQEGKRHAISPRDSVRLAMSAVRSGHVWFQSQGEPLAQVAARSWAVFGHPSGLSAASMLLVGLAIWNEQSRSHSLMVTAIDWSRQPCRRYSIVLEQRLFSYALRARFTNIHSTLHFKLAGDRKVKDTNMPDLWGTHALRQWFLTSTERWVIRRPFMAATTCASRSSGGHYMGAQVAVWGAAQGLTSGVAALECH